MNELANLILKEKNKLQETRQQLRKTERAELKKQNRILPPEMEQGRLVTESKKNKHYYYVIKPDGKRSYLKKKTDYQVISRLAQKEYNGKLLNWLDQQIKRLEMLERKCPDVDVMQVYNSLNSARKDVVSPIVLSDEEYARQWEEKSYLKNDYALPENYEEILTKKGERVRSKSEKIIADMLYDNHVPYRYEPECVLNNGRSVYPDFIALNKRTRKEILWEHLGMLDDAVYFDHNITKLRNYELNGYLIGDNLILSFETSTIGLATNVIQDYITRFLI